MAWVEGRYAVRSVGRNVRRTALSVVGIGVGLALALFMESMNRGRAELFSRAAAYSGAGHLRVTPAGWRLRRDPRLRLAGGEAALAAARALPGVAVATPRARAQVLLAMGTRVVGVEAVGVDPATEPAAYRFVRKVAQGRYLEPAAGKANWNIHAMARDGLRRELSAGHPLYDMPTRAVGRRQDCDDVLFSIEDGSGRVAVVHLTWTQRRTGAVALVVSALAGVLCNKSVSPAPTVW